jgi:regulator of RNase E activity RraA
MAQPTPREIIGCILSKDVGEDPVSGGLGENMGLSVQVKGCVGVVCDGGTRDKKALIKAGFPVFSRFSVVPEPEF